MKKLLALMLVFATLCMSASALAITFQADTFTAVYNDGVQPLFTALFDNNAAAAQTIASGCKLTQKSKNDDFTVYANDADSFELVFSGDGKRLYIWCDLNTSLANIPAFGIILPLGAMDASADSGALLDYFNNASGARTIGQLHFEQATIPHVASIYIVSVD